MSLYKLTDSETFWEVEQDTRCLVSWGHNTVVVAFRGTASMRNALADMQVRFTPCQSVCDKHNMCDTCCLIDWGHKTAIGAMRANASMRNALADMHVQLRNAALRRWHCFFGPHLIDTNPCKRPCSWMAECSDASLQLLLVLCQALLAVITVTILQDQICQ